MSTQYTCLISTCYRLLAIFLAASLSACGGDSSDSSDSSLSPLLPVSTAVFIASDTDTVNGDVELYSVEDDGANLRLLSVNMVTEGAQVLAFEVSPDGRQVAFSAVLGQDEAVRLFVVPVDGGTPVQVTPEPPPVIGSRPPSVFSFDWSPDSQRLVMAGNLENTTTIAQEIFVVDADGTGFEKINGSIGEPPTVEVRNPQWSPDGKFIIQEVARFSEDTGGERFPFALNIFDVEAGMPNSLRLVDRDGIIRGVTWSPTSEYVCYRATDGSRRGGEKGIYISDPRIGARNLNRVSEPATATGDSCSWSSDGRRVAFNAGPRLNEQGLQIVAISEGGADGIGGFTAEAREFSWSPDDAEKISFNAPDGDGNALFVWNVATDARERVSGTLPEFADVTVFEWAPAGDALGFVVSSQEETSQQLFSVAPGNAPVLASASISADDVVDFAWSPTSERLAFSSKIDGVGSAPISRLTAASEDGSDDANLLNRSIFDVIAVAYEGAGASRVALSSLFPPPQPPGDTEPSTVTINSIAVVGFPATTSTGYPWDRIALLENAKRADIYVNLSLIDDEVGFGFINLYISNQIDNAFPNERYVFTEPGSQSLLPSPGSLPQTVDFSLRNIIINVEDADPGFDQEMARIPYIPVNRRSALSMGETISLSRDGVMIELNVTYGF